MNPFHQLVSKKMWFILFNLFTLIYLRVTGRLQGNWESICTAIVVLVIMNAVALISARNFPGWK
jgi:hypothetical protein